MISQLLAIALVVGRIAAQDPLDSAGITKAPINEGRSLVGNTMAPVNEGLVGNTMAPRAIVQNLMSPLNQGRAVSSVGITKAPISQGRAFVENAGEGRALLPNRPILKALVGAACVLKEWPTNVKVFAKPDEFFVAADSSAGQKESGFLVELLDIIQNATGAVFTVTAKPELSYGRPNENGTWDGTLIAPLLNNEADLVGPSMTITSFGKKDVDYCVPILPYKLHILFNPKFGLSSGVQYLIMDDEDLFYLKNSKDVALQSIYQNIQAGRPQSIVKNNAEGVAKVLSGNFAYIEASPFVEQALLANGQNLAKAEGNIGKYFYLSFAAKKGSGLCDLLDVEVLKLQEDGTISKLLEKYNLAIPKGKKVCM